MDRFHITLIAAFAVAVMGGLVISSSTTSPPHTVPACFEEGHCNTTVVEQTWSCPADARKAPNCTITRDERAIEEVTFVSGPKNHITAPLANVSLDVRRIETEAGPWDFEFLPSGAALMTDQRTPNVYRLNLSERYPDLQPIGQVTGQVHTAIYGTQGLAIDPDFEDNHRIYVFYVYNKTDADGTLMLRSKVAAYRYEDGSMEHIRDLVTGIIGHEWHNGGRLEFGPDGKLYVTTGDGGEIGKADDHDVLLGKVLRINPDGTIPEDNPFNSSVYTTGHRNVQGIDWQPGTGDAYVSEHGSWRHDEVNRLVPGDNYGWGRYACGDIEQPIPGPYPEQNHQPVRCFDEWTLAPSDIEFVNESGHPWHGDAFLAGLRSRHLHRLQVTEDTEVTASQVFWYNGRFRNTTETGGDPSKQIRDVEFHDGALWLGTTNNIFFRLRPR